MHKDKFLKFLIFFFLVSFFFPYPLYYVTSSQNKTSIAYSRIKDLLEDTQSLTFEKKIDVISQFFLGKSYDSPVLGEGEGSYQNLPLYRFDKFDCTTYVETVLALANSIDMDDFERHIRQIRYKDGSVSFVARNHFPSSDWIPNNVKAGYVNDATSQLASEAHIINTASSIIDKKVWYEKLHRAQLDAYLNSTFHIAERTITLPYLRYENIFLQVENNYLKKEVNLQKEMLQKDFKKLKAYDKHKQENVLREDLKELDYFYKRATSKINKTLLSRMPRVSVLNLLRFDDLNDENEAFENVFLQGFVIRKDNDYVLRHASSFSRKVVEVQIEEALEIYLIDPTIGGANILSISKKEDKKNHARKL